MADAPLTREQQFNSSRAALVARYPADLCSPPFDKWIMFSAMTGRHVVRSPPVTEHKTPDVPINSVALYLPNAALASAIVVDYEKNDLGPMVGAAVEFFAQTGTSLFGAKGGGVAGTLDATLRSIQDAGKGALSAISDKGSWVDFFKADASQLLAFGMSRLTGDDGTFAAGILSGTKPNPRTDILYNTQDYRTNELDFLLVPRTLQEAKAIDTICYFFNYYMLPRYQSTQGLTDAKVGAFTVGFPYEFEINMFAAGPNGTNTTLNHINRIARSVLRGVSIDHAAGGKTAFIKDDGEFYPVATKLCLSFQEVRLLARDSDEIKRDGEWNFDNHAGDPRR
jgi:hypothetical protein